MASHLTMVQSHLAPTSSDLSPQPQTTSLSKSPYENLSQSAHPSFLEVTSISLNSFSSPSVAASLPGKTQT